MAVRLREQLHQLEHERAERWLRVPSRRGRLARPRLLGFARVRVRAAAHTTANADADAGADAGTDDEGADAGANAGADAGADGAGAHGLADDGSAIVVAACDYGELTVGDAVETLNGHPRPPQLRAAQFAAVVTQQPLPVRLGLLQRPPAAPAPSIWRRALM